MAMSRYGGLMEISPDSSLSAKQHTGERHGLASAPSAEDEKTVVNGFVIPTEENHLDRTQRHKEEPHSCQGVSAAGAWAVGSLNSASAKETRSAWLCKGQRLVLC